MNIYVYFFELMANLSFSPCRCMSYEICRSRDFFYSQVICHHGCLLALIRPKYALLLDTEGILTELFDFTVRMNRLIFN